jgi:hypothetical protein
MALLSLPGATREASRCCSRKEKEGEWKLYSPAGGRVKNYIFVRGGYGKEVFSPERRGDEGETNAPCGITIRILRSFLRPEKVRTVWSDRG